MSNKKLGRYEQMANEFYENTPFFATHHATPQQKVMGIPVYVAKMNDSGQLAELLRQVAEERDKRATKIARGLWAHRQTIGSPQMETRQEHGEAIAKAIEEQG